MVQEEWVCSDAAKTGSTTVGREGFQRLLSGVRQQVRPFDVVVVDDLGRLTREADRTISIFKELQARGIRLIGVSDGFDSSRPGAKLEAGLRGIINEAYLDDLAKKTHRGVEGQFLRGFHCGGHLYGYRSEPVYDDGAPIGPRGEQRVLGYAVKVHEPEAEVIRRIFRLFTEDRLSINAIARLLNSEEIPWPGARTHFGETRKGWAHASVVSLLDAEKYVGNWTWNRTDWFRDPSSGKRRPQQRPESEWVRRHVADLRIIDGGHVDRCP